MTAAITFPNVTESFKRALHEVLTDFFDGEEHVLGGIELQFPESIDFAFQIEQLSTGPLTPNTKPVIAFLGNFGSKDQYLKCKDPSQVYQGYELRAQVITEVLISIPLDKANPALSKLQADKLWQMLFLIFATQHAKLSDLGISHPILNAVPTELPSPIYAILTGLLRCELVAQFVRDAI